MQYPDPIAATSDRSRTLAVIQTGGTIGSRPDLLGDLRPDEHMLDDEIAELAGFDVRVHRPFTLPSPHVTPAHMHELRELIHRVAPEVGGIVVTHGTDTLEETAFYLHLTVSVDVPVVITGSMRHSQEPSWDGPFNLWSAAHTAMHEYSRDRGVMVVFSGDVFDARTVTKVHTTGLEAFSGYPGPIGRIDTLEGRPVLRYFARPERRTPTPAEPPTAHVEILTAYAGWRGEGFTEALERSDGLVIAAMGCGNLPPDLVELIEASDKPVVISTRTDIGPILPIYGYEGGGKTLQRAGAIPASFLNAFKARIKLILLLSRGFDLERIEASFRALESSYVT